MSRRSRILVGVLAVYLAVAGFLLLRIGRDIDPRYRESTEEVLVDTANLLATLLERRSYGGVIPTDELERTLEALGGRPLDAQVYDIHKTRVDLIVYVTDAQGTVLYHSRPEEIGEYYGAWRDVWRTLAGDYGARTTPSDPSDPASAVMYVGAPIREAAADGTGTARIVGMVAVGKPVATLLPYIAQARAQLLAVGALSALAFGTLLALVAAWVIRPLGLLRDLWGAALRGGGLRERARRVAQALRTAFADLRDAVAGRSYVDDYVQTLAHEIKSPLSAIRGAAELLREPMAEPARARFAGNVVEQVARAQALVERMLELSGLERRGALDRREAVALPRLAETVRDELAPIAARRGVELELVVTAADATVRGDPVLLQRAAGNLVLNAIEFAVPGSRVTIGVARARRALLLTVRDRGPGLPAYARHRVFEKFYSLPRPDTGRKGTGLGLALVREVAALHGGAASLDNHPEGGALATLSLPAERSADG